MLTYNYCITPATFMKELLYLIYIQVHIQRYISPRLMQLIDQF